jgi:hypothetical protein
MLGGLSCWDVLDAKIIEPLSLDNGIEQRPPPLNLVSRECQSKNFMMENINILF